MITLKKMFSQCKKIILFVRNKPQLCFIAVGSIAAATHQLTVMLLVQYCQFEPLVANIFGFFSAWLLSYLGHYYFTFNSQTGHLHAAPRFFITAVAGFLLNQIMYAALLKFTNLNYAVALLIVLVTVAITTYIFSKLWAFKQKL